jgi:hypothetical protein
MVKYQIANSLSIDKKINIKENAFLLFTYAQYKGMIENNRLAIAPYYQDKLIMQGRYVAYRQNLPQWVKDMEKH